MKLLFLLLISYVIFPVCLPNVLFGAEQECFCSCCPTCQHDPCLCSMQFDEMIASEIPSTDAQQQPMQRKRYQCTYPDCVYATAYSSNLKRHACTHTGEKPYTCTWDGCGRAFTQSSNLINHARIHTGERPYECPYPDCEYAAAYESGLTVHIRAHTGEKPYKCPHPNCKYAAAQSSDLTRHMCTHTEEKPYKCNSCERKYRQFFNLKAHSKRMHGIEIPLKKGGRPPKRTQKNLDNDKAGTPEDQETKRVHLDAAGGL